MSRTDPENVTLNGARPAKAGAGHSNPKRPGRIVLRGIALLAVFTLADGVAALAILSAGLGLASTAPAGAELAWTVVLPWIVALVFALYLAVGAVAVALSNAPLRSARGLGAAVAAATALTLSIPAALALVSLGLSAPVAAAVRYVAAVGLLLWLVRRYTPAPRKDAP